MQDLLLNDLCGSRWWWEVSVVGRPMIKCFLCGEHIEPCLTADLADTGPTANHGSAHLEDIGAERIKAFLAVKAIHGHDGARLACFGVEDAKSLYAFWRNLRAGAGR